MFRVRSGPIERGVVKVPNDLLFYSMSGHGGNNMTYYCRTMRSRGELWLVAIVLCLTMWSGPWLCLTLCCVMEDKVPTGGCLPTVFLGTRRLQSTNDASISWLNLLPHVSVVIMRCWNVSHIALRMQRTHRAWMRDSNIIYHLQATPPNYGSWIMYSTFNSFSIGYIHIILFNDVVPHNTTMKCWEFNMDTSLPTHLFAHSIVTLWGSTKRELNAE